ncbi:hypothetical protein D9M71_840600 [compost metagenome]
MHVAFEPRPIDIVLCLAERGYVGKIGVVALQCLKQFLVIELRAIARPLEQHDLARIPCLQQIENHRLRAG